MTLQSTETAEMERQKSSEVVEAQQSPSLARHVLRSTTSNGIVVLEEMEEVGSLYEIDHSSLPPDSPSQLRPCRVVMVSGKTEHNVSVRFPSRGSIREYFRDKAGWGLKGKMYPTLDQKYEMELKTADRVLSRRIPAEEIQEQINLRSFWSVQQQQQETEKTSFSSGESGLGGELVSKRGKCWSELKREGLVKWGTRRRVRFVHRHLKDKSENPPTGVKEEEKGDDKGKKDAVKLEFPETRMCLKRKRQTLNGAQKVKREKKEKRTGYNGKILKNSKDRWSAERYKIAEEHMLKIMKAKGAVIGNPILRPELRVEARKRIGDTGLLDHLLKHMAGKVAPGGADRFRRRHNADGAMEYWLESADLVNVRREAGVQDPYWTPPLGWKPGDSPTQDPVCAKELKQLKEEMAQMKRVMEELASKKQHEGLVTAGRDSSIVCQESVVVHADSLHPLKKMHDELVKTKAIIDEQLSKISYSLKVFEEETTGELSSTVEEAEKKSEQGAAVVMGSWAVSVAGSGGKAEEEGQGGKEKGGGRGTELGGVKSSEEKAAKIQRLKSGFRLCKPQGTFRWPSSEAVSSTPQLVVQVEDLLPLHTPPSVSSATPPPLPLAAAAAPPPPPTSPVKPLAEKRRVNLCTPHRTTTLINLNELPSVVTASTNNGSRKTIAYAAPSATATGKNGKDAVNPWEGGLAKAESKNMIGYSHQRQQQRWGSSNSTFLAMELGAWLALTSPNSMDSSHRK